MISEIFDLDEDEITALLILESVRFIWGWDGINQKETETQIKTLRRLEGLGLVYSDGISDLFFTDENGGSTRVTGYKYRLTKNRGTFLADTIMSHLDWTQVTLTTDGIKITFRFGDYDGSGTKGPELP